MSKMEKIDPNFKVSQVLGRDDMLEYDVCSGPFRLYGLIAPVDENDCFRRMPKEIAQQVSEGVAYLHEHTAGGRVRFRTDSACIGIRVEMGNIEKLPNLSMTNMAGFDLYQTADGGSRYECSFVPPFSVFETGDYVSGGATVTGEGMREYTLNFPLYGGVKRLHILLEQDAKVLPASDYTHKIPIVYYGNSVTQGGCASRPGCAYESKITRKYDIDHINLGFSGSAKGELAMAQYLAGLQMCALVMDYDHNAPTPEHLRQTHEPFFKTVRAAQPNLPIICISKARPWPKDSEQRREIIRQTVENARAQGDTNAYFIDRRRFAEMYEAGDDYTVDRNHPNDLGFHCMARVIGDTLADILSL